MTDLSALSDDDLMASLPKGVRSNNPLNLKDAGGQFRSFPTMQDGMAAADQNLQAYKTRHGINTINGVVGRWAPPSDGNDTAAYAAHVAKATGIAPDAPIDLADAHTRQSLLSAMGEHENGTPVAPAPKADLSQMSDADLLASIGQAPAAKPKAAPLTPAAAKATTARANPTIAQDAASGFAQPFVTLGHDVMQNVRANNARLDAARRGAPMPSLLEAGKQSLSGLGSTAKIVGDVLGLTSAPIQAAVRPAARAVNNYGPTIYAPQTMSIQGGKPVFTAPRALHGDEAQASIENSINTALAGARPANGAVIPPRIPPKNLAQLDQEQSTLWKAVDASGYRFPKADVTQAAADIRQIVNDAGPDLYENSAKIATRVESLAAKGDLTPAQANRLRSQIGEKLLAPGSTEGSVGGDIKARLDTLINSANDPTLEAARQSYKQFLKYKEVSARLEDAGYNQAASGTGGNSNAGRQALKPLIKNKSSARLRNLTPDETGALKDVVNGTPVQNLLRAGSAFDPFHSKLAALIQGGLGIKTGGLSAATIPLGMAATAGEKAISARNIQALLDLISTGGARPTIPPYVPAPVTSMLSPAGLTGAGVIAAPLTRLPSAEVRAKTRSKSAQRGR